MNSPASSPRAHSQIEFWAWQGRPPENARGRRSFASGDLDGCRADHRGLTVDRPTGERVLADPFVDRPDGSVRPAADDPGAINSPVRYQTATWTSPLHRLGFGGQQIIVSWNALTPGHSWIEVQIQPIIGEVGPSAADTQTPGPWFTMARWCRLLPAQGGAIHRASVAGQSSAGASVDVDTLAASEGHEITGYRLRVILLAPLGAPERPVVSLLGAVAWAPSRAHGSAPAPSAAPGPAPLPGMEIPVPPLSQMTHRGQYPQWGGGGESWCSPTSVAMTMGYHRCGPTPAELAWVQPPDDRIVAFSARATWDHQFQGAGNWAFSTAYPAEYCLEAFVTRLAGLAEMAPFIAAGIPLVASLAFDAAELDGSGYSTEGHLMLVIGFTSGGDVIVNDPASHDLPDNDQVRVIYRRDQFERIWQRTSKGTVYVIHPARLPLPPGPATGI